MDAQLYDNPAEALAATSAFYAEGGFSYRDDVVQALLDVYLRTLPAAGKVLDLCCGDGVWARGIKQRNPRLRLFGIDIAEGGVRRARTLVPDDAAGFVVGDAERGLPWPDGMFELIFARGPGLYNQHSMERPGTVRVIERWHRALAAGGAFVSVFYSNPSEFGRYTPADRAALPFNRSPRRSDAVDFRGGKYHHDAASFLAPFRKARNVAIQRYRFARHYHVLETRLEPA